jgi:DNA-binding response OmpR family regulator
MRILVVEDNEEMADALVEALDLECYAVDLARDGETARRLKEAHEYDLVVMDWSIPPPTGVELLRMWRRAGDGTPVLMLTGKGQVRDRVSALDIGADDYLTKPFAFAEFLARVRSLMRRRERVLQPELRAGDLRMDRATHEVTVAGEPLQIPPKEFALLEYLLTRKDRVVRRGELVAHVWSGDSESVSNVIDVLIHRLRKKIDGEREGRLLHTIIGVGYLLKSERTSDSE